MRHRYLTIIAILIPLLYVASYFVLRTINSMTVYLRSEASYSIFVFVKTGSISLSDFALLIYKPLIYADGMQMRLRYGLDFKLYPNQLGLVINVDQREYERQLSDEKYRTIDGFSIGQRNQLAAYLQSADMNGLKEYCLKMGINQGPVMKATTNLPNGIKLNGTGMRDYDNSFRGYKVIDYFDRINGFRGVTYQLSTSEPYNVTSIEIILE